MEKNKSIRELMNCFLEDLPDKLTDDDVSLIILTLLMTYEKNNSWFDMQDNITFNMIAFLERGEKTPHATAVIDADNFLKRIIK